MNNIPPQTTNNSASSETITPLLPRSAWNSQIAFLRVMFRAKKALDRLEKSNIKISEPDN